MWKDGKWVRNDIQLICKTCGKPFKVHISNLTKSKRYCSVKCYNKLGKSNPKWRGGKHKIGGYTYIYKPNHPKATSQGYVCEHRLVMEKSLNRYLKSNEIVHHLNEVKTDNRIENLFVTNRAEHMTIHHKGIKQTPEHIQRRFANRKSQDMSKYPRNSLGRFI